MSNKIPLVDTHTHLCDPSFDLDREDVIMRAQAAGIAAIVIVSENMADAQRNLALAEKHPILRPAAGLYPTVLDLQKAAEMWDFIKKERSRLFAIGEVGLDYWVVQEENGRKIQQEIFKKFIDLSIELNLVINVHSRSAGRYVISTLLEQNAEKVQLHAFDGKASTAQPALEAGYFFSIPPSITRSRQKQKLVKQLPLSCLLLETDSPVLGPIPNQRNEPANITHVVDTIAEIKKVSQNEVIENAFHNTVRLYGDLM